MMPNTVPTLSVIIGLIVYGIAVGAVYPSIHTVRIFLGRLFLVPYHALKSTSHVQLKQHRTSCPGQVLLNITDFVYFLIVGLIYILLAYVLCDAEIRFYQLLIASISFFLSKRFFGSSFSRMIDSILDLTYRAVFFTCYYLMRPLHIIILFLYSLITPIVRNASAFMSNQKLKHTLYKKERKLQHFFRI